MNGAPGGSRQSQKVPPDGSPIRQPATIRAPTQQQPVVSVAIFPLQNEAGPSCQVFFSYHSIRRKELGAFFVCFKISAEHVIAGTSWCRATIGHSEGIVSGATSTRCPALVGLSTAV